MPLDATATVCVTLPLSPGLPIRIETFTFDAAGAVGTAGGGSGAGAEAVTGVGVGAGSGAAVGVATAGLVTVTVGVVVVIVGVLTVGVATTGVGGVGGVAGVVVVGVSEGATGAMTSTGAGAATSSANAGSGMLSAAAVAATTTMLATGTNRCRVTPSPTMALRREIPIVDSFAPSLAQFLDERFHDVHDPSSNRGLHLVLDRMLDSKTRRQLVEQHLPLARGLARRHAGAGETFEDLVQVGALGLVAAARRYDPERGIPFAAYAAPTVDGELRHHLRDRASTIRVPRREQALAGALRRAAGAAAQRLGHDASLAELAGAAGLSRREAEQVLGSTAAAASLTSLDGEASVVASAEMEACEDRALLRVALATLEPRERCALALRFGAELPLRDVGTRLGLSQRQAARVVRQALEKVRTGMGSNEE